VLTIKGRFTTLSSQFFSERVETIAVSRTKRNFTSRVVFVGFKGGSVDVYLLLYNGKLVLRRKNFYVTDMLREIYIEPGERESKFKVYIEDAEGKTEKEMSIDGDFDVSSLSNKMRVGLYMIMMGLLITSMILWNKKRKNEERMKKE